MGEKLMNLYKLYGIIGVLSISSWGITLEATDRRHRIDYGTEYMHSVFNEPSCTYNSCMDDRDTGGNLRESMRSSMYNAGCIVGSYWADITMSALGASTGLGVGGSMALTALARASHASEGVGHAFGSGLASWYDRECDRQDRLCNMDPNGYMSDPEDTR